MVTVVLINSSVFSKCEQAHSSMKHTQRIKKYSLLKSTFMQIRGMNARVFKSIKALRSNLKKGDMECFLYFTLDVVDRM